MADVEKMPARAKESPASPVEAVESQSEPAQQRRGWYERLMSDKNDPDVLGRELLVQSQQFSNEELELEEKRVRRRTDRLLLPLMCGTYMISFLDKQTLNYSNAYGLQADTNMTGNDYSWVASALNIGWLVAALPWNWALQRYPIGRMIGYMLFVWGTVCMLQAAVFNFAGFFAIRFFLGALEAVISPAFILLTSLFWKADEQSLRSSTWLACNGFSSILGAVLAYGSGSAHSLAIPNWKLIYLIVGSMTICWGFVIVRYLPDGPHNPKFLNDHDKMIAVWRISKNRMGLKDKSFRPEQVWEVFRDPKVWMMWPMGAAVGILNGGVANFASALIKGFGFSPLQASLMQTPGGAFEIIGCIAFGFLSRLDGWYIPSIIISCFPGMAGLIGILTIDVKHKYSLVAMAWLHNVLGAPLILSWTLTGTHIAGHTKRSIVMGGFFTMYCAGNIAGPHLFLGTEAPRYPTAIKGLLGAYVAMIVLTAGYWSVCWNANRVRDRHGEKGQTAEQEQMEGFDGKTDLENLHFRYRL